MLLALLQPLERDSMPDLGRALLQLDQGDTAQATAGLERVAAELPASHGGAELYLLAGRLSAASGKPEEAERLLRAAAVKEAPSTAPAAELALAELLISGRRGAEAVEILEHLILTYSRSALVPQARRKLDEARGSGAQDMRRREFVSRTCAGLVALSPAASWRFGSSAHGCWCRWTTPRRITLRRMGLPIEPSSEV